MLCNLFIYLLVKPFGAHVSIYFDYFCYWILGSIEMYEIRYVIWYHLYNFKKVKNTHGGALLLVKLQALACNFTKNNTPPWVFFIFFKLYKWHQIAQSISYENTGMKWVESYASCTCCYYLNFMWLHMKQ